jgi:hypothetical protein
MAHAAFDAEVVGFGAGPPGSEFREGEAEAEDYDGDGPLATARRGGGVARFGFGCEA